jgi:hypothetical protein
VPASDPCGGGELQRLLPMVAKMAETAASPALGFSGFTRGVHARIDLEDSPPPRLHPNSSSSTSAEVGPPQSGRRRTENRAATQIRPTTTYTGPPRSGSTQAAGSRLRRPRGRAHRHGRAPRAVAVHSLFSRELTTVGDACGVVSYCWRPLPFAARSLGLSQEHLQQTL